MNYLLGIDFGGGASKATLIDTNGTIVAQHTVEYPTLHPEPGACEQRPTDWIRALCEGCRAILEKSGIRKEEILSLAIDSATHTFLLCDEDFNPLRNAVHWTDSRSGRQAEILRNTRGDMIFEKTFHKPDTIWTLPQLIWLREHESALYERARYLFFEKDYIRYFLTGVFCTDTIEAQGSMMFDCNTMTWDRDLVSLAGLGEEMLPPVRDPSEVIGRVTEKAAEATGLCIGTPVICGTTDTAVEILASGAVKQGDVTLKLATAGRICIITDKPHPNKHLVNYSHIVSGLWYPGTATKSCAASYRWFRDSFGGSYEELNKLAQEVPIGCEGLIFHPYLNGELTPYADPLLCGSFTGVRSTHTKSHFTRAVLEGVAFSMLDCKKYLDSLAIPYENVATAIGGGTKGRLWRQMISDALGMSLRTTESSDSSLGSAMLAGMATGVFSGAEDAVAKCVKEVDMTRPNWENYKKYQEAFEIYQRIRYALAPIYHAR